MEHDPLLHRVRNWLGFAPQAGNFDDYDAEAAAAEGETAHSAAQLAVRAVMDEITGFLIQHHLPLDVETMAFAHDLVTGADSRLQGLLNRRLREGQPVDREWIGEMRGGSAVDDAKAMADLRQRLEKSIGEFGQTTKEARTATSDYRDALATHVDELGEVSKAGVAIQELATVARAMLERTHDIEQQMVRSERETRLLQRRLDEARRHAELDHLTGLPNRRAFESLLESEFTDARKSRDQLCVAFCDIDKFKLINDVHGHEAGDRVLKLVARTLADISDDRCHVARHGGEEFVVLFRGKSIHEAYEVLDSTRESLALRRLVNRANDTPFGQVSFSGGIADILAFDSPRSALKAADEALYLAKDQGRNRIVLAPARQQAKVA